MSENETSKKFWDRVLSVRAMTTYSQITMVVLVFSFVASLLNREDPITLLTVKDLDSIQDQISQLSDTSNKTVREYQTIKETLNSITFDPQDLNSKMLDQRIQDLSLELENLKNALGDDVERTLSVSLLRNDLKNLREQVSVQIANATLAVDRVYDQNKWFLAILITAILGNSGILAAINRKNKSD